MNVPRILEFENRGALEFGNGMFYKLVYMLNNGLLPQNIALIAVKSPQCSEAERGLVTKSRNKVGIYCVVVLPKKISSTAFTEHVFLHNLL